LYERSAKFGEPKAMMALGRIFENGLGTKVDLEKAYFYYD
jgi:TPR repeat protein